MKAILDALNVVYEEKEKRGFIKLNLVTLCFTLAAIAALLLALGAVVVTCPSCFVIGSRSNRHLISDLAAYLVGHHSLHRPDLPVICAVYRRAVYFIAGYNDAVSRREPTAVVVSSEVCFWETRRH